MRRFDPIAELRRFLPAQQGATAIEYAMIAGGIGGAMIAALSSVGVSINQVFTTLTNALR